MALFKLGVKRRADDLDNLACVGIGFVNRSVNCGNHENSVVKSKRL